MNTLIEGGIIVNEGRSSRLDLLISGDEIAGIFPPGSASPSPTPWRRIDATGCYLLPGIIDSHVHFREPGLTEKADIESESRAAARGGVTSYMDMPNTSPQTTTLEALSEKFRRASASSHVNYGFFFGATNDNFPLFSQLDVHHVPGIKLFMGSSTGNMLVERESSLDSIFSSASSLGLPVMAHCEDTSIINANLKAVCAGYGDDPPVALHPLIRSEEACVQSTLKAISLARKHHARLHVAHISTAEELELFGGGEKARGHCWPDECITAEATVGHLLFSSQDYARLGTRIKVNPSIKSPVDQFMLRQSLSDGRITTIGTDHAPHLLSQKEGGCVRAASGMPMVQFALPAMLELTDSGVLTLERMVELMCHNPARLFEVSGRGFLRPGYKADIVLVRPESPWTVTPQVIESKCGWSPLEGHKFSWRVERTICNGHTVYDGQHVDSDYTGQELKFRTT